MIKAIKHMRAEDWGLFLISVLLVGGQVWFDMEIPAYMSTITTLVRTQGSEMVDIWSAGGKMLLCALGSLAVLIISGYVSAKLAAQYSRRIRREIFQRVQEFSMEEIDNFSTASLITRSTNDVTQIQMFVARGLRQFISAPLTAIWALSKIAGKQWQWTAVTGGAIILVLCSIVFIILYAQPRFRRMQGLTDDLNRVTRDNLTGIRVIRAYNAEGYQEEKFDVANSRLTRNALQAMRAMGVTRPVMRFTNNMLQVAIYCAGAYIIARQASDQQLITFSEMVVFSTYASRFVMSFMSLEQLFGMVPRVNVSAGRIDEVLETEPRIHDGQYTDGVEGEEGSIVFEDVSFRYPGTEDDMIHNISFTAKKGETVAFIGATGSGKSTIVNLLLRFYDATEGTVSVDGRNVKDYTQTALHNKIGYAPQRAVLLTGTVNSNVTLGDNGREEGGEEAVKQAVAIAQATEFVEKMENGYDADINRGGTNVSGGQKQRLSIARAVYRKPEIYIFDDTFSALDYKTDRTLRAALKAETADVTTILVAQRIGTIRDADKIIVLDEGRIVGMGTHSELMRTCDVYQEIAYTQLSEEELANG